MATTRHAHDPATLERMAPEVGYELRHVCSLSNVLVTPGGDPRLAETAFLEAYLLRVRNVDEFFLGPSHQETDVRAVHYFDHPPELPRPLNRDQRSAINTRLSHLSTERLNPARWDHPMNDGARAGWAAKCLDAFERFLDELEKAHPERRSWFTVEFGHAALAYEASLAGSYVFERSRSRLGMAACTTSGEAATVWVSGLGSQSAMRSGIVPAR